VLCTVGNLFASSRKTVSVTTNPLKQGNGYKAQAAQSIDVGVWQQWSKKINAETSATAVLLMNNGLDTTTVTLNFADVPSLKSFSTTQAYSVRCLYGHKDLGEYSGTFEVALDSHDSRLLMVTPVN
jgi:hypothetical protein